MKQLNNILVKPAGPDCNLACRYCFYYCKHELFPGGNPHRMSLEVLEEMLRQLLGQSSGDVSIGWQGGEPTLMGLDFFRRAVELEQRFGRGQVMGNGIQTNGMLLDRDWAAFFREYNFLVGLSIDGPEHVHDHYRRTAGDRGSWAKVFDTARLLLDAGVAVNALSVVNEYSARHALETYDFLKENGLTYMQFIPCVETHEIQTSTVKDFSVTPDAYGSFLCAIFDRWIGDFHEGVPDVSVRFFDSVFYHYVGMHPPDCTLLEECGTYVVVEHNADVYSCDFFVGESWLLGNLMEKDLAVMLNSPRQLEFGRIKSALHEDCIACPWLAYCRGGCPKDRHGAYHENNRNYLCEAYRIFFEHADPVFTELAAHWKARRNEEAKRESAKRIAAAGVRPGRNDPCPCGSGLKYKKCCG